MTFCRKHQLSSPYCSSARWGLGCWLTQLACTANPQPKSPGPISPVSHFWPLIQLYRGPSLSLLLPSTNICSSGLLPGQEPS